MSTYGEICTLFYELDKPTAPELALAWYERTLKGACAAPGARVLEPMCGSGRFLVPLLKRGLMVDGFDTSEPMLKACRDKAAARFAVESPWGTLDPANAEDWPDGSRPPTPRIRLWQQALETMDLFPPPPQAPPNVLVDVQEPVRYAAAFIPSSSFCLLEEPAANEGLQRLRRHLAPGALLLIEFEQPRAGDETAEDTRTVTRGSTQVRLKTRVTYDAAARVETAYNQYELKQSGRVTGNEEETLRLRCYTGEEMTAMLRGAGFGDVKLERPGFGTVAIARNNPCGPA